MWGNAGHIRRRRRWGSASNYPLLTALFWYDDLLFVKRTWVDIPDTESIFYFLSIAQTDFDFLYFSLFIAFVRATNELLASLIKLFLIDYVDFFFFDDMWVEHLKL